METAAELAARSIVTTRIFDAPRALVFEAWTDPKHLAQWWGPTGFTTTTSAFALKPGGIWRFVMHGPDGRDYQNRITFEEVTQPERLVYRHDNAEDVEPIKFRATVTFEAMGAGKTRLTLSTVLRNRRRTRPGRARKRRRRGRRPNTRPARGFLGREARLKHNRQTEERHGG